MDRRCRGTTEQIKPVLVNATQIATPQRHAVAVEEFENLDRHLAAVIDTIAELRCSELPVGR
ncbi:MAG TPA: hypothetical protein VEK31_05965 [Xanthobacteraceae bacterium]|nr:hypothetical protein [Xanthobacteraceae bacterium]